MKRHLLAGRAVLVLALVLSGCGKDSEAQQARVEREMKAWLLLELRAFRLAAVELEQAAPTPNGRGWSATEDAAAINRMKGAWGRARHAYELIEGAVAPLFPDSDTATDARYEDFMALLGAAGDPEPFDARGVVGVHAIERVLWANAIPAETIAFESRIPGYRSATFPRTEGEARDFKNELAARLVTDIEQLEQQLLPIDLDIAFAFRGLIDLTREQLEKVDRAATGREESRYAQATLKDLRANREGCLAAYRIFRPWLLARGRSDLDAKVLAGFERLRQAYDALPGAAMPAPPRSWSSLDPQLEQLGTPFGRLFEVVKRETDEQRPESLAYGLMNVADALDLPRAVLR